MSLEERLGLLRGLPIPRRLIDRGKLFRDASHSFGDLAIHLVEILTFFPSVSLCVADYAQAGACTPSAGATAISPA